MASDPHDAARSKQASDNASLTSVMVGILSPDPMVPCRSFHESCII